MAKQSIQKKNLAIGFVISTRIAIKDILSAFNSYQPGLVSWKRKIVIIPKWFHTFPN